MEILERQRQAHEDIERMEQAIVDRMAEEPRTRYDALAMEHQVAGFLTNIQRQADFLVETYRDEKRHSSQSGSIGRRLIRRVRQKEIESMAGSTNEFDKFYQEYAELREIHRRHPNLQVEDLEKSYRKRSREEMEDDPIINMFTGEESWGRFIDLHTLHEMFFNLRGFPQLQYIPYLNEFQHFRKFNPKAKNNDEYLKYLIALQEYLESFLRRVQPIVNHQKLMNKISNDFENAWENGTAPGQKDEQGNVINGSSPLYCEVCQKQFAKETVYNAHLDGNKHKKNAERDKAEANGEREDEEPTPGQTTREQRRKEVSRHEYTITKLCQGDRLSKVIPETIFNVERRSLLSDRERQKELQQLANDALNPLVETAEEDENDGPADDFISNPLKLPLGWDGKPIPFWLYKLHGLGHEYPCEICGNLVYTGRKNFEKHFGESTHIHGLRCLGITNGPTFKEVTSIEEALQLWNKTVQDKRAKQVIEENKIEMEDDQGNVMSEKTYNDLKAQGII